MSLYTDPPHRYTPGIDRKHDFPPTLSEQNSRLKGDPFTPLDHSRTWERCVVQAVYPANHSCDVYTEKGKYLAGVAWPDGGRQAPRRGDLYVVHFQMGRPTLVKPAVGTKVSPAPEESHRITPTIPGGVDDPLYANKGSGQHRGDGPQDMYPGDWVEMGSMGNLIGVLEGGSIIVKASDLAQIIATQAQHMLRLVGKNIKMDTGGGTLDFHTSEGKSTLNLYMGSDEETESSPDVDNFRIRCELGADGELVDFRVTDPKGRSLYRMHVDPDGRVQRKSRRETSIVEEDIYTEAGSDVVTNSGGGLYVAAEEGVHVSSGSSVTSQSGGDHKIYSAKDAAINAMQDILINAARNIEMSSSGSVTDPGDSFSINVSNGDMVVDIGNPLKGDAQISRSGLEVNTFTGDIQFKSMLGGFKVNTSMPGSVKLGGPGPGVFSAVLFEMFSAFMELFGTLLDTHVHAQPALGGVPTTPPLVPIWNSSRAMFNLSKSNYVTLGG